MSDKYVMIEGLNPGDHFQMAGELYVKTYPYSEEFNALSCQDGRVLLVGNLIVVERVKVRVER